MSDMFVRLEIPAKLCYLSIIGNCINEVLAHEEQLEDRAALSYNLQLAAQEIAVNIVEHAYAGGEGILRVELRRLRNPRRFALHMFDTGASFDAEQVQDPELGRLQEGGYGLFLARSLLDELSYERHNQLNCWRLIKQY